MEVLGELHRKPGSLLRRFDCAITVHEAVLVCLTARCLVSHLRGQLTPLPVTLLEVCEDPQCSLSEAGVDIALSPRVDPNGLLQWIGG